MRLDLINSRFKVGLGPRIYDSIEGDLIEGLPASPKAISRASFLSKQNRLDYGPKSEPVPDRFSVAVVDRNGNFLPMDKTKRIRPANSVSTKKSLTFKDTMSVAQEPADALLLDAYPSKIADYMKDHIYDVKEDTVVNRIQSKKLPGGTWEVTGRKSTPPAHGNGPGDYDVYRTAPLKGGHFKTQPSGREHEEAIDPDYLPLKERQRYRRMKAAQDAKLEATLRSLSPHKLRSSLSALSVSDTLHTLDSSITGEDSNISPTSTLKRVKSTTGTLGGSGVKDRFDDKIYKQECFIKTSGMTLSGDWDKKLNKRIAFSFQPPSHNNKKSLRKPARSEGSDVDVDVGHMFSIVRTAELSPVKYSAAFRSSAKVGMEIPVPTSGTEIGPCSFPGAHIEAIQIKQPDRPSHFLLRGRPSDVRAPAPDLTQQMKSFSETHQSGPIFEKHIVGGGNVVLQAIVKQKMQKIYPKLADQKYPPPEPVDVPSPWGRTKRK